MRPKEGGEGSGGGKALMTCQENTVWMACIEGQQTGWSEPGVQMCDLEFIISNGPCKSRGE